MSLSINNSSMIELFIINFITRIIKKNKLTLIKDIKDKFTLITSLLIII